MHSMLSMLWYVISHKTCLKRLLTTALLERNQRMAYVAYLLASLPPDWLPRGFILHRSLESNFTHYAPR